jgi:hypothetical protein
MPGDRDDVLATWLAVADAASTITLCGSLADGPGPISSEDVDLAVSVGREARARFPANVDVLLAVSRLYVRTNNLEEARWTMAHATTIAADDTRTFGLLGEILLRLGDARRSAAAFEAAIAKGADDAKTLTWHEQAQEFVAIQDAHGEQAVAKEAMVALGVSSPSLEEPEAARAHRASRTPPVARESLPDAYVRTSTEYSVVAERSVRRTPVPGGSMPEYSVVSERTRRTPIPGRSIHEETTRKSARSDLLPHGRHKSEGAVSVVGKAGSNQNLGGFDDIFGDLGPSGAERSARGPSAPRAPAADAPPSSEGSRGPASRPVVLARVELAPRSERKGPPPLPVSDRPEKAEDHAPAVETKRTPTLPEIALAGRAQELPPQPIAKRPPAARVIPWSQWARRGAVFVIITGILGLGAVETVKRYGTGFSGTTDTRAVVEVLAVEAALRGGGPSGLAHADEALARARAIAPNSADIAVADMRVRVMYALEGDEPASRLAAAIETAAARGATEGQLGTARVALAIAARNTAQIDELVQRADRDARAPFAKALNELVAGAALELKGNTRAIERYQAAVAVDPEMIPAKVRLIRAMLLYGDVVDGRRGARALSTSMPGRAEAAALLAVASVDEPRVEHLRAVSAAAKVFAELPRPHRSLVRALEVTAQVEPAGRASMLAAAVAAADSPAVAAFCGSLALDIEERAPAEDAAKRALELAPAYPQALVLAARVALAAGRLDTMEEIAAKLDPTRAAEFQAVAAYEAGNLAALQTAVRKLAAGGGAGNKVCAAGEERLRGVKRLTRERILALAGEDHLWGDLVAVDAALDAGDVALAAELESRWSDPKQPLRAARIARRLRYEGQTEQAREAAAGAAPTPGALLEQLVLARSNAERAPALAAVSSGAAPASRWLHIYGMALDGSVDQGVAAAGALELPSTSAPLGVRVAAALALAELKDTVHATTVLIPLVSALPGNHDVISAAVRVRLLPEEALKR